MMDSNTMRLLDDTQVFIKFKFSENITQEKPIEKLSLVRTLRIIRCNPGSYLYCVANTMNKLHVQRLSSKITLCLSSQSFSC